MSETKCRCEGGCGAEQEDVAALERMQAALRKRTDQEFWDKVFVAAVGVAASWDDEIKCNDGETLHQAAARVASNYADAALAERNKRRGA